MSHYSRVLGDPGDLIDVDQVSRQFRCVYLLYCVRLFTVDDGIIYLEVLFMVTNTLSVFPRLTVGSVSS